MWSKNLFRIILGVLFLSFMSSAFAQTPDLIVTNITVIDSIGPEIKYRYTIKNQGTNTAPAGFTNYVYLSYRISIFPVLWVDTKIDSQVRNSALAPGESYTTPDLTTIVARIPDRTYYLSVKADGKNTVSESNEDNNLLRGTQTYRVHITNPDLIVKSPLTVTDPSGPTIQFSSTIKNESTVGVTTSFDIAAYLSPDTTFTTSDYRITTRPLSSLNAGIEYTWNPGTVNVTSVPEGSYYLGIWVDYLNTVYEGKENNNITRTPTKIITVGRPDLIVTDVQVTSATGPRVSCTFTLKNQGLGDVTTTFKNYIILSRDQTITVGPPDSVIHKSSYVSRINAGQTTTPITLSNILVSNVAASTYYLGVYTDAEKQIGEINENNNSKYDDNPKVTITNPDLQVTNVTVLDNIGRIIKYKYTIKNNSANLLAGSFKIKIYLSTDQTISSADYLLKSETHSADLTANQEEISSDLYATPGEVPEGVYYLGVIVDADNEIYETNESTSSNTNYDRIKKVNFYTTSGIMPAVSGIHLTRGSSFDVKIMVGVGLPINNLFGLSFTLNYTQKDFIDYDSYSDPNNWWAVMTPFVKADDQNGKVDVALTRQAGQAGLNFDNINAFTIKLKSKTSTPNGTVVNLFLTNIEAIGPSGNKLRLSPNSWTVIIGAGVIVWPGDTNNDGVVNQADVLPIGVNFNKTGPTRPGASNTWTGQYTTGLWTPEPLTYVDANGNGLISSTDKDVVDANWGRSCIVMTGKELLAQKVLTGPVANLRSQVNGEAKAGHEFWVELNAENVDQLFGLSFEMDCSPASNVEPLAVETGNWFGDDPISISHIDKSTGTISFGVSKTAGQEPLNGTGVVARIKMKLLNDDQPIHLSLQNIVANDAEGMAIHFESENAVITGVSQAFEEYLPNAFALHENYPNPFNSTTSIGYDLPDEAKVRIDIFNILGEKVFTLVDENKRAGRYTATWNGRDSQDRMVSSGIYIYRMEAGSFSQTRRMLLLQ